jgi:hypothetical protein
MYRPALNQQQQGSVQNVFFSEKNYNTLQLVLLQDFQVRNGSPLSDDQRARLGKTLDHYLRQVYDKQGEKPITTLNKEVLGACAKDFSQYMQRKEIVKGSNPVKQVMDDNLFMETSQRFEKINQERNEVKALPPALPDFRISLSEDGPPAAEMFERAKKMREMEALRSQQAAELAKADAGLQGRIQADNVFQAQQEAQNRNTQLALVQRTSAPRPTADMPLAILPDRRELLMGSVGSFDGMTSNSSNGNATIAQPLDFPVRRMGPDLPQNVVIRPEPIISYREIENNLFLYSADRDWLRNNKENRYNFTVNFDPAANGQNFGPTLSSQQKFKNIVRIEFIKAILPGEGLQVSVNRNTSQNQVVDTSFQDNVLNLPFITLRVAELENNNYGTDQFLDRSFGVLQYDNQWISDKVVQSKGFMAMIPKFLKCQKEYYPTPLSTLQKMTIELRRPNGELVSSSPDTFDIAGIIAPQTGTTAGTTFPFSLPLTFGTTATQYNVMVPAVNGDPANFYINTSRYFSKFEISTGDRIQISGYTYAPEALNDETHGGTLRAFCNWINRVEGHTVLGSAYSSTLSAIQDGFNDVGYANFLVIPALYQDPSTGSTLPSSFGPDLGATLNAFGVSLQSPVRLMNMNKQISLVFRIITREMDSLPQLRPENNY